MTTELADKEDRSRQAATRSDEAIRKQREVQLAFDKTAALIAHKEAEIERQKQTCESLRGHVAQLETTTASALSLEFERDGLKQLAADLKLQRDQLEALRKDMDKAGEQRDDAQRKLDATAKEVGEQRALVEAEKAELRAQLDRVEAREAALNAADDEKRQAEVAKLRRREQKIAAARADLQHRWVPRGERDGIVVLTSPHCQACRLPRSRSTRVRRVHPAVRHTTSAGAT
jgi:predicted  nucleic acid-binding Zn-ribbon protein